MAGEAFTALSDVTRRRILELLQDQELTAGEIAEHFDLSKATLSHHLAILKNAGLVSSEKEGLYVRYRLNTTVVQGLMAWLFELTSHEGVQDHED
ncbi:autorepressor SdpR family transcription factor [uncultured Olegusella sp.]|uniref:autorepressor SdpR family transcription factor n=1 Tax=uncultured Olegusella sp. TaxID=1979846 RepID=UPI002623A74E|nr:autorepressor SdpR family transcription factor [uncultured Olegusella sp.]